MSKIDLDLLTIFHAYDYHNRSIFHRQLQVDTKTASFYEKAMKCKWLNDLNSQLRFAFFLNFSHYV